MDYTFIYLITVVLMILGILGTFIPVLPGLLLSLCGLLIYKFGTDAPLSMVYVWIFVALTAVSYTHLDVYKRQLPTFEN